MKKRLRTAGLVLIAAAVILMIYWESAGRERFLYEEIPVMAKNVPRGTVITRSMITMTSFAGVHGCLKEGDEETVVGMTAGHDLHAGMPLFMSDLTDPKGEAAGKLIMTVLSSDIANGIAEVASGDSLIVICDGAEMAKTDVISVSEDRSSFDIALTIEEACRMSECSASGRKPVIVRE